MTKSIDSFQGEYRFLSNFWIAEVRIAIVDGDYKTLTKFPSVENAYQALKSLDPEIRKQFINITPSQAKRLSRKIELRPNWEDIKIGIMTNLCKWKFSRFNPHLVQQLLDTGDAALIEGVMWHDFFWGVCNCDGKKKAGCPGNGIGENHLGQILMQIRAELQQFEGFNKLTEDEELLIAKGFLH